MTNERIAPNACDALLEEHRKLMGQIGELRQWWSELDELGTPKYGEMGTRLKLLREILAEHFREEENGGYLAAALAVAPRFQREAEELCAQHPDFLASLDQFVASLVEAESGMQSWQEVRDQLEHFLSELRRHEARENAVVQSAFGDDIGTAD